MSALLRVSNLTKHYDVKTGGLLARRKLLKAVDGIGFTIEPGKTFAIVGESGCGKSTTGSLVMGALAPTSGEVSFEGRPVHATFDRTWRRQRRHIQMVYQNPLGALDRRIPIGDQISEPLDIHGIGTEAERQWRVSNLLDAVGLSADLGGRFPHELSGGQRQRVVIARALILEPRLVICDEPVAALDVSIAAQVVSLLRDLQTRLGVAYLFISHDLKIVRRIAHEVAVMYLGRIVEQGDPVRLFDAPAHPYTRALVSAVPQPGRRLGERILLAGDPPNPIDVPSGCAFHTRCPIASAKCRLDEPQLETLADGRHVACHFADETKGAVLSC